MNKKIRYKFIIVIPARYNSTRLPGKPLLNISGDPMIVKTFKRCLKVAKRSQIFVATENKKILEVCKKNKINCLMTSAKCLTGTDRIAEVAKKIKSKFYINVQGDEPLCDTRDLKKLIKEALKFPKTIINGYAAITNKKQFFSGNIPKVVFRNDGRLLYQSRAAIPTTKKHEFKKAWRQICIYSLPYEALKIFSKSKNKTILESIEDCELNRFLELGLEVKMIKMSNNSIAVDTKEDLKKVRNIFKRKKNI